MEPHPRAGQLSPSAISLTGRSSVTQPPGGGSGAATVPTIPLNAATPHRHRSVRLDHTPTQSQLNWPSVHRSYSSANATRDSSRGPRPSSSSIGNASCSETRLRGQEDRPRSSVVGIPLLVDVAEMGGIGVGIGGSSTAQSHPTTATCTPRECATPPPVDEIHAEAERLSREELVSAVEALQTENLVLRTSILRDRDAYAALKEGMRETYTSVERTQESITNSLMRRLDSAKKVKERLAQRLAKVEQEKTREEMRLQAMQRSISRLTRHLKREEGEISAKMQEQLQYLQAQRAQLNHLLAAQTDSLQQLEELVNEVQKMDFGAAPATASGGAADSSAPSSRRDSTLSQNSNTTTPAPAKDKGQQQPQQQCPRTSPPAPATAAAANPQHRYQRSSSQLSASASASVMVTSGVEGGSIAYSSREMVSYLEQEIAAVESLRKEVLDRAETYSAKAKRLEEKVAHEMQGRQRQQRQVQDIQQELADTSTAVKELSTQQELNLEVESERRVNAAVRCESLSRRTNASSSNPNTPRGPGLTDALLMPTSAKYVNPAAVKAFQTVRSSRGSSSRHGDAGAAATAVPGLADSLNSPQSQQQQQPVTGTVNLADVVLVPGTEKYAIPATSVAAMGSAPGGASPGHEGALPLHQPYVPISQQQQQQHSDNGPSLLDALLVPGAGKYTLGIDPTNAATTALMQQMHRGTTGGAAAHTPSPSPAPPGAAGGSGGDSKGASPAPPQPPASRISVQDTSRMNPARPLSSAEVTPKRAPSAPGANPPALELERSSPPPRGRYMCVVILTTSFCLVPYPPSQCGALSNNNNNNNNKNSLKHLP